MFLAISMGLLLCFVTPPFEVPDEVVHYYRAFQVSEGHLASRPVKGGYGDFLPRSLESEAKSLSGRIPFNPKEKYDFKRTLTSLGTPLHQNDVKAVRFEASATYSPAAYLPQSIGIGVGRVMELSPLALLLIGRICNLLAWLALVFLAIKVIPVGKWALLALALTPMSIFQAASVSPDAMLNGAACIFLAICLRAIYDRRALVAWEYVAILGTLLLLALTKIVYLPLAAMLILVPKEAFSSLRRKWLLIGVGVVLAAAVGVLWTYHVRGIQALALANVNATLNFNVSPSEQLNFVLSHPGQYVRVVWNTYLTSLGDGMLESFIGTLGWLDTRLPLWVVLLDAYVIVTLLLAIGIGRRVPPIHRIVPASAGLVCFLGVTTALYLYYTSVMGPSVIGLQGRYLIPVAYLLIPIAAGKRPYLPLADQQQKRLAVVGVSVVLLAALSVLLFRYYWLPLSRPV
jgi:uncharacterized membrane protein